MQNRRAEGQSSVVLAGASRNALCIEARRCRSDLREKQRCAQPGEILQESRVLAERLRMLEARGFVYRKYEATIPPTVTYRLTSRMDQMRLVLEQLDRLAGIW